MHFFNSNIKTDHNYDTSDGPWLINKEGEKFFDCWLGAGTLIFGHEKIQSENINYMLPETFLNQKILNSINELVDFNVGGIGIQTSGSSAVTRACRIARAVTSRKKIALIADFWHGSEDPFLFRRDYELLSEGLVLNPQENYIWYSSIESFLENANLEEFAALLIEPRQGSNPDKNMLEVLFQNQKRDLLREKGVLLILDEIITAFREVYGSNISSRKSNPDIVIFGKAIAGGYPTGLVTVEESISLKAKKKNIFWGGTFSGNPWQIKLIESQLDKLSKINYTLIRNNLSSIKDYFSNEIKITSFDHKLSLGGGFARILPTENNIPKTSRGFLNKKTSSQIKLESECKKKKIYIPSNRLIFPSIYNIYNYLK